MEGKKIKQIGMQRTTGGWNEGGVKLGQLGVPAPGKRVGSIFSLSLSLVFSYTPARTRERARRHASAYMHALPPSLFSCFSYFPSFPPSSVVSAQQPVANPETHVGRSRRAANEKREKEKVDSLPTRRADGSLESWDSLGRGVTELWYQDNYIRSEGCEVQ